MNTSAESNLIHLRAQYRSLVRAFFDKRGYLEVDTPTLSEKAPVDAFIDPLSTGDYYLHTSPEYAMKELLANHGLDIYFLGHVFRKEEKSPLHKVEFTMLEWYKTNTCEEDFLHEVTTLLQLFLGPLPVEMRPYQEAFEAHFQPLNLPDHWTQEEKRHYTWAKCVEPHLGKDVLTIIHDFPIEDAALATTTVKNSLPVANRFEYYYQGIELANGFHELTDPIEQKKRFEIANQKRLSMGKEALPIDTNLLAALEKGLPKNTYGMALGFDRLLQITTQSPHITHITF